MKLGWCAMHYPMLAYNLKLTYTLPLKEITKLMSDKILIKKHTEKWSPLENTKLLQNSWMTELFGITKLKNSQIFYTAWIVLVTRLTIKKSCYRSNPLVNNIYYNLILQVIYLCIIHCLIINRKFAARLDKQLLLHTWHTSQWDLEESLCRQKL